MGVWEQRVCPLLQLLVSLNGQCYRVLTRRDAQVWSVCGCLQTRLWGHMEGSLGHNIPLVMPHGGPHCMCTHCQSERGPLRGEGLAYPKSSPVEPVAPRSRAGILGLTGLGSLSWEALPAQAQWVSATACRGRATATDLCPSQWLEAGRLSTCAARPPSAPRAARLPR